MCAVSSRASLPGKPCAAPPKRQNAPNRLTGLLYCADCGSKLTHRYNLVQGKWIEDAFVCSGYRQLTHDCTMHYIPTAKIEAAILAVIQRVSWYVRHNEKEFTERVREASDQNQEKTVKECKQKINKAQKRHKEFDGLVKRYTDFSELTTLMLNEFIEKVVVHEGEGRGKDRRQRIDIYRNFIGAFEVPEYTVTPEEQEAEEKRLAHNREWQKEWREKRKATEPEKPPKQKSIKELMAVEKTGADLTPEETERLAAYRRKKADQQRARREGKKSGQPKRKSVSGGSSTPGGTKEALWENPKV